MSKELSQNLDKAPHRALYKSMGLTEEDLSKPFIAIITDEAFDAPELTAVKHVTENLKTGITAAGGVPLILPISGLSNTLSSSLYGGKYTLPSRELIADTVESLLNASMYDGVVIAANSDEGICGALMGALRVNLPCITISAGPAVGKTVNGQHVSATTIFEGLGAIKANKISKDDFDKIEKDCAFSVGCGVGMYNANSFACLEEALGIALPGNGTTAAGSSDRARLAKKTGETILRLVNEDMRPKMILSKDAFFNAFCVGCAIGVTTSSVLNLVALASECDIELSIDQLQLLSNKTPMLCQFIPNSPIAVYELGEAGGISAVIKELSKKNLIEDDCRTCSGVNIGMLTNDASISDENIIAPMTSPISNKGDIVFLKGNLAEDGAIAKRSAFPKEMQSFKGTAVCFDREEDAVFAISNGSVPEGSAIVVRYEGPKGGPGMRELISASAALAGSGLAGNSILITDGRLSGITKGCCIGHACPEAYDMGKLAAVENGDIIKVDINSGRIELDVIAREITTRLKRIHQFDHSPSRFLLKYSSLVQPASEGCIFKKKF